MHNKKIIAKGMIVATALANIPVDSLASTIEECKTENIKDNTKENEIGDGIKNLFAKVVEPIENLMSNPEETIKVNRNIIKGSVLEIELADGEFVPNLKDNPDGYETIRVTTTGNKKLVEDDYDNLRTSKIPKIDLSNAHSDSIPAYAFNEASHLTEFKFPQGITSIGYNAFCFSGLTGDLVIPDSVVNIDTGAFMSCGGLTGDLVIPDSVINIEQWAFYCCSGFNGNLILGNSVKSIGTQAFIMCTGFTGDLIIPDSVTDIGKDAFCFCDGFNGNLILGNSVTNIGANAFSDCYNFTGNLIIPDSVMNIGKDAFDFHFFNNIDKILIKVDSSDLDTNYKESIIANLPNETEIIIDIPYDFDITGTWMETTSRTIGKPIIKNVVDGIESDLVNFKGDSVSLYIPSLYQESNVTVLKNNKPFTLPTKDANNKHLFTEPGIYQVTVITDLGNTSIINFEVKDKQFEIAEEAVEKAESDTTIDNIESARDLINNLPESTIKDQLQDRLDNLYPNISLESKTATANLDIYIKSENMLSLSLDTNNVTFTDFSGIEDTEKLNAINLTVNSSLPYKINAYLVTEIQNADKSKTMDKDTLNIKANGEADYNTFADTATPIVLLDDQPADNNVSHGIDLMLKGNLAHEKDVYKTTIKFEAEQK